MFNQREYIKKHYHEHKQYYKSRAKKYYQENKDMIKERVRLYQLNHKEEIRKYQCLYHIKNKERLCAKTRKWRLNNPERKKKMNREYREKNRDEYYTKMVLRTIKYRALKRNVKHDDYSDWYLKLRSQVFFFCHWCKKNKPITELNIDHIIPISKGGNDTKVNVTASCSFCNKSKGNKLPSEWVLGK